MAAHISHCGLLAKAKTGRFEDPEGYAKAVADCEAAFRAELAKASPKLPPDPPTH